MPPAGGEADGEEVYTPWFRLFQNAFDFSMKSGQKVYDTNA
jgi:hypothetical protein